MASIYAELHVAGHIIPVLRFTQGVAQATHQRGRVATKVKYIPIDLTASVPDNDALFGWAADPQKRQPAQLVVLDAGVPVETIAFKGAYCVSYHEVFQEGDAHMGAYVCHFTLSDPDGWTWQPGGPTAYVAAAAREHGVPPVPAAPIAAAVAAAAIGGKRKRAAEDEELVANTPEHKADRWARYQKKHKNDPKAWSEARWSNQYDTNMQNVSHGLKREREYASAMGGVSKTLKTPYTQRQIDIFIEDADYCGQLKTGKVGLGKQAKIDLQKDEALIQANYDVEYILEKGGSKPLLAALKKIGASVKIGPQIP